MFAAGVTCSDCHEPHGGKLRAPPTAPACNATRPTSTLPRAPPARARRSGARPAPPATCRSAPTWGWTGATTTASASRAPTSRPASAPRTPATTVTPTRAPSGRPRRSNAGTGPNARASRPTRGVPCGLERRRGGGALLGEIAADRKGRRSPAPAPSPSSARSSRRERRLARAGLADPDPMVRIGAIEMLEGAPANRLWPLVSPLLSDAVGGVRIRAAALLASARGRAAGRGPRAVRSRGRRVRRRATPECGSTRGAHDPGKLSCATGRAPRPRPSTGPRCGSSPTLRAGGGEPGRPLSAARAR